MNLDDLPAIQKLDPQNMLAEIDNLPNQLAQAWALGKTQPLPNVKNITRVVVSGMGGSAIGADLLAGYALDKCKIPVIVHRDYGLPAFASGPETLFIASSHSGNTEETLDSFGKALERGCSILAVSTGGKLAERAAAAGCPVWLFSHKGQPRAAVGFSFGLLLAAFARLGLLPEQSDLVTGAVEAMKTQQKELQASIPAAQNPAKRYAGQLVGRWVTVFGSGVLATVARRWKGQINELAKAPANFEFLPEADHNTLAGIINPSAELLMPHTLTLFLAAGNDHPRNRIRSLITRETFMVEGLNTDVYKAPGETSLAQMWNAILFGDYMAYYLAIAYATDPTPVDALLNLKAALAAQK
ncbi:MAG TPA: bifunctional phosphoglucose/phosphomannose isomerase [Anaerolineales bacterium]|jgi:glucose/mannose-6-phosphate isomerase